MVKKASGFAARIASFSARSAVRTARIGPAGGAWSPNRLRSALLNGRSQANALPPTSQVRSPRCFSWPSVTSGSWVARRATSSKVCTDQTVLRRRLRVNPESARQRQPPVDMAFSSSRRRERHIRADPMGFSFSFEQAFRIVVQDRGLLGDGETEVGDGAGGGQRFVERIIAAEDDPVGGALAQHPGELLGKRAAREHRAGDRDVDPDISPPRRIAADN